MLDNNALKEKKQSRIMRALGITNRAWTLLALFTMGAILLQAAGGRPTSLQESILAEQSSFNCTLTNKEQVRPIDKTDLNTLFEISRIDIENETYQQPGFLNEIQPVIDTKYMSFSDADLCMTDKDEVIAVKINDKVRIYPQRILNRHVVINDTLQGTPIAVIFSGFSQSFHVFERVYKNEILDFAGSGLLYKNTDLIFDNKTDSLWSVFSGKAMVGKLTGAELKSVNYWQGTYSAAKTIFPDADFISFDTGRSAIYSRDRYEGFAQAPDIIGPVGNSRKDINNKDIVIGFIVSGNAYAVPASIIEQDGNRTIKIGGKLFTIKAEEGYYSLVVDSEPTVDVQIFTSFWYTWADHYPDTRLF